MKIQSINTNATNFAPIQAPVGAVQNKASLSPSSASDRVTISQAAVDLAAQSAFTQMTPNQMRSLAREWYGQGKIDPVQLFELENAGVPLGRMGENGEFIPLSETEKNRYANTPVNYLQIANNAVRFLEDSGKRADPTSTIQEWKGILALLQGMQGQDSVKG